MDVRSISTRIACCNPASTNWRWGRKVYFAEAAGEKGPQASTVRLAGK